VHERAFDLLVDLLQIRLPSLQEFAEVRKSVGQDSNGVSHIENDDRLINIRLEIATSTTETCRHIIRPLPA
jgi:hypothetical protein